MEQTQHPLKLWREKQVPPLSQEAFSQRIGVTKWTINSVEVGRRKPSLDLARQIADATGIPKHELRPDVWETVA